MSIPVELDALEAATGDYAMAYLLTVSDDFRPKIVACVPDWDDGQLVCRAGGGSARNAATRSAVTLAFPPIEPGGYTLIVDGNAHVDQSGEVPIVHLAPTRAVLHRTAPSGFTNTATNCASDCTPIPPA